MPTGSWVAAAMDNDEAMAENSDEENKPEHKELRSENTSETIAGLPYYIWIFILIQIFAFIIFLLS